MPAVTIFEALQNLAEAEAALGDAERIDCRNDPEPYICLRARGREINAAQSKVIELGAVVDTLKTIAGQWSLVATRYDDQGGRFPYPAMNRRLEILGWDPIDYGLAMTLFDPTSGVEEPPDDGTSQYLPSTRRFYTQLNHALVWDGGLISSSHMAGDAYDGSGKDIRWVAAKAIQVVVPPFFQ